MTRRVLPWTAEGWEDYLFWQGPDGRTLRRVNLLLADVLRGDRREGIGRPEPLKHALAGAWSRRMDESNRLVYLVTDDAVVIPQARYHY